MQSGESGKLKVEVVEGKNIPAPDGRPSADTYVTLTITGEKKKTLSEKTKVQKKGLEAPKWAQSFEFSIDHHATELQIQVQDWNRIVASEILASATVSITKELVSGAAVDKWFPLSKPNSKSKSGELHLKLSFSKKNKKGTSNDNGSKAQLSPAPTDGRRPSVKGNDPSTGSLRTGKSEKSDPEIFKYVRENNFDKLCEYLRNAQSLAVNELDSYGYTPLQVACSNKEGDERIIARLLEVPGVDVATPIKSDNNTALHYFCQYYKSPLDADELFQMFIKLGADVNAKNNNHETPIFKAIWNTSIKLLLVEKLLECGAEVNIFNIPHGKSVLHYAVHLQREDLMHLFLKAGADITAKGKTDNKTPYELANDMKQTKMAETLRAVQELHEWLTSIGCGQWKEAFMKKEIFTKQQLLQADLEKPALEAMGLTDKELRHKLHKAVKSLKKENKGSEGPTQETQDSSAVLTKILADLEAMGIKKNEFILNHKDLEFTKKLGSGAAGDVFKGLFKGIPVAIKVLKEAMAEKELAEFKKEFFILASVRSPYTVHFFGAAFGQKLEMVMELCSRGSLYDVMRDPSVSLGWSQFFAMSLECSLGLEVLHNHTPQIVHRDLKSLNLLVTQDWHVKVCDFGLSRFDTQANDETLHQLRGTMAFCLASNTPVTLASGISMKIKDLAGLPEVLTLGGNGNFVPAQPSAHLVQGRRECIELLFSDGRTLVCTPDHEIRTTDGWCRADTLVPHESRVLLGLEAPLYDPTEDEPAHLAAFQLTIDEVTLRMSDPRSVARAHAFARILGSLYTDGSASYSEVNNSFKGALHLRHRIDVYQAKKDIMLVLGECANILERPKRNHYKISLPSRFICALNNHPKIHFPVGNRKYRAYLLPELVTDPACPKSFVREFLGGLFGGDGSAPVPNSAGIGWLSVKFMTKEAAVRDPRDAVYQQITALLARFNITKISIDSEQDVTGNHPGAKPGLGETMLTRTLRLSTSEIVAFQERVGFRYCAHKQQRLSVAASFCRADEYSRKQTQELVKRVDEMTGYSRAQKQEGKRPKLKMSITKAYDVVVNDMKKSELFLNEEVAIPKLCQVQDVLKGNCTLAGLGSKSGGIKPFDFIASVGATRFFSDSPGALAASSNKGDFRKEYEYCRTGRYGDLDGFPTWTARIVGAKPVGVQDVYDISVPMTESFLAMGVTVHNCAPEVYHSSKFTPKSDVYSLVIVLWELINRIIKGVYEAPYSEYKHLQYDFQIIIQVAKKGLRPTIPPTTPPQLVDLLKRGMDADPEKRPALREFVDKLTSFQKEFATNSQVWDRALLDGRALSRGEKTLSSLGLNQPTAAGN